MREKGLGSVAVDADTFLFARHRGDSPLLFLEIGSKRNRESGG